MKRIAVVEDHKIVRRGLSSLLSGTTGQASVVEVGSREELLNLLRTDSIDALVLDLAFAGNGFQLLREIRELHPQLPVVLFGGQNCASFAVRALRAGATAYVHNETEPEELIQIVGHATGTRSELARLADVLRHVTEAEMKEPHEMLSPREFEIFHYIAEGETVGEIARRLNLSVKTISTYRSRILEKMSFSNNVDIMRYALLNGPL